MSYDILKDFKVIEVVHKDKPMFIPAMNIASNNVRNNKNGLCFSWWLPSFKNEEQIEYYKLNYFKHILDGSIQQSYGYWGKSNKSNMDYALPLYKKISKAFSNPIKLELDISNGISKENIHVIEKIFADVLKLDVYNSIFSSFYEPESRIKLLNESLEGKQTVINNYINIPLEQVKYINDFIYKSANLDFENYLKSYKVIRNFKEFTTNIDSFLDFILVPVKENFNFLSSENKTDVYFDVLFSNIQKFLTQYNSKDTLFDAFILANKDMCKNKYKMNELLNKVNGFIVDGDKNYIVKNNLSIYREEIEKQLNKYNINSYDIKISNEEFLTTINHLYNEIIKHTGYVNSNETMARHVDDFINFVDLTSNKFDNNVIYNYVVDLYAKLTEDVKNSFKYKLGTKYKNTLKYEIELSDKLLNIISKLSINLDNLKDSSDNLRDSDKVKQFKENKEEMAKMKNVLSSTSLKNKLK